MTRLRQEHGHPTKPSWQISEVSFTGIHHRQLATSFIDVDMREYVAKTAKLIEIPLQRRGELAAACIKDEIADVHAPMHVLKWCVVQIFLRGNLGVSISMFKIADLRASQLPGANQICNYVCKNSKQRLVFGLFTIMVGWILVSCVVEMQLKPIDPVDTRFVINAIVLLPREPLLPGDSGIYCFLEVFQITPEDYMN